MPAKRKLDGPARRRWAGTLQNEFDIVDGDGVDRTFGLCKADALADGTVQRAKRGIGQGGRFECGDDSARNAKKAV